MTTYLDSKVWNMQSFIQELNSYGVDTEGLNKQQTYMDFLTFVGDNGYDRASIPEFIRNIVSRYDDESNLVENQLQEQVKKV